MSVATRLLPLVLVLAMVATAAWRLDHPPRSPREEIWLRTSERMIDNGFYREAYERARKVLTINPDNGAARDLLDVLEIYGYLANREPSPANLAHYERVRQAHPGSAHVYMVGAELHAAQGDYAKAFELYREAAALRPDLPHNWYGLGLAYRATGAPEEALTAFEHAAANGRRGTYSLELAREYFQAERYADAATAYQRSRVLNPRLLEAYIGELRSLLLAGHYDDAMARAGPVIERIESSARYLRKRARFMGVARHGTYDEVNRLPLRTWKAYALQLQRWAKARSEGRPAPPPPADLADTPLGDVLREDLERLP